MQDNSPRSVSGAAAETLALISRKSAPTPQMRHKRRIIANVRRSRMRLAKFYPVAANSLRIPQLSPCPMGKVGTKHFFFSTVHGAFSF